MGIIIISHCLVPCTVCLEEHVGIALGGSYWASTCNTMWTLKLVISHWPQHCSLAVHIPVPEAIMSEECTRLPKKTPMKITGHHATWKLAHQVKLAWNHVCWTLTKQSVGQSNGSSSIDKAKLYPDSHVGRKIIQKIGTIPLATAVFLPQNGLKTLRSGPFNAGESSQSWPYRIPVKAGHNYMVQHGVLGCSASGCGGSYGCGWGCCGCSGGCGAGSTNGTRVGVRRYILSDNPLQKALFWKWCRRKARFYWNGKVNIIVSVFFGKKHSTKSNIKVSCNRLKHQQLNNHRFGIPKLACWRIDSTADEIRISAPSALVAAQCEWSSHVSNVQSTPRFLASNDRWVYYHIYSVYIDKMYLLASSQWPFKILEVDTLSFPHSPKAAKRFQIDQHIRKFYKRNQFSLQVDQSPQDELKLIYIYYIMIYIYMYTHLDLTNR